MPLPRYYKIIKKMIQSNHQQDIAPFKLTAVVTKKCQSRCVHCKIWQEIPENEMVLQDFEKVARGLPNLLWLDLTGGEPTDREDLPDIVEVFDQNCPDLTLVHFPTNGINTPRIVEAARTIQKRRKQPLVVSVSLDGPPELHGSLRGISNNFSTAIKTFVQLKKIPSLEVYFGMTLFNENVDQIPQTLKAIEAVVPGFKATDLHVNIGHYSPHYYGNTEKAQLTGAEDAIARFIQKRGTPLTPFQFIEWMYLQQSLKFLSTGKTPHPCEALRSTLYLSEKGEVYPCSIWNKPMGSVKDPDFDLPTFFQGDEKRKVRQQIQSGGCPQCWTPCEAYPSLFKKPWQGFYDSLTQRPLSP